LQSEGLEFKESDKKKNTGGMLYKLYVLAQFGFLFWTPSIFSMSNVLSNFLAQVERRRDTQGPSQREKGKNYLERKRKKFKVSMRRETLKDMEH
jgi:hypothetical protein